MTEQPISLDGHDLSVAAHNFKDCTCKFPRTGIKSPAHETTEITTTSLKPPQGVWIDDPKFLIDLLSYAEEYPKWIPQYRVKLDQLISQLTPPLAEPTVGYAVKLEGGELYGVGFAKHSIETHIQEKGWELTGSADFWSWKELLAMDKNPKVIYNPTKEG